jgi:hypothetical protein
MDEQRSVPFGEMLWTEDAPGIQAREAEVEGTRWAVVEYEEGASRDDWCEQGHRGYVIAGRMWRQQRRLPPSRRLSFPWGLLDAGFVRLAAQDPRLPLALLGRVMRDVPLAQSLGFIDERVSPGQLGPLLRSAAPVVLRKV